MWRTQNWILLPSGPYCPISVRLCLPVRCGRDVVLITELLNLWRRTVEGVKSAMHSDQGQINPTPTVFMAHHLTYVMVSWCLGGDVESSTHKEKNINTKGKFYRICNVVQRIIFNCSLKIIFNLFFKNLLVIMNN